MGKRLLYKKKKNYFLTILKRANRSQSSSSRNFHFFIRHPTAGNGVENGCRSSRKDPSQAATIKEKLGSFDGGLYKCYDFCARDFSFFKFL